jgi:transposase-like protein
VIASRLVPMHVWTWTAICADTELVPSWVVGGRDSKYALAFVDDLCSRLASRVQLTSDGHSAYLQAVEEAFGADIDCAMLQKLYGTAPEAQKRYSRLSRCLVPACRTMPLNTGRKV